MKAQPKIHLDEEIEAVCLDYGFSMDGPAMEPTTAKQLEKLSAKDSFAAGRRDLRQLPFVTIDGDDSQDYDDAVHCQLTEGGNYVLTVAIADVSHYVRPGDTLDLEAERRGTSVYFPGKALPMLPPQLANDWCSLCPDQERLGLACEINIRPDGQVIGYAFFECLLESSQRLTYGQAEKIMAASLRRTEVEESLHCLSCLTKVLIQGRSVRGGLQLETVTMSLDIRQGQVKGVQEQRRLYAHKVIEECMLVANICAANFLTRHKYPFLFRVHDKPDASKAKRLQSVLREFGIKVAKLGDSGNLQKVIDEVTQQPDLVANVLTMNVLRTLQRAQYTPHNIAHYGLGYEEYTHFTSPIRRYPDLLVHRAIKAVLRGKKPAKGLKERLVEVGLACSEKEMAAERAGLNLTSRVIGKMQQQQVGKVMRGAITGMSKGGFFVACEGAFEGMVRFSGLPDDYYELNQEQTKAVGRRRKRSFHIGMVISVRLESVNLENGHCALSLED